MTNEERGIHPEAIRRILVALDASVDSLAALKVAARLAANLEAELVGLFVEDINLLRLAGLPFAREFRFLTAIDQQMSSQRIEAEMKMQAARARRALTTIAEETHVRASFRVVRGRVPFEVLAAALETDLLLLGRISRPLTRRVRLGSTARTVAAQAPHSVLLMQGSVGDDSSLMVTYDGSALGQRALETASYLAQPGAVLIVLLVAESAEEAEVLQAEATIWLEQHQLSAAFHRLKAINAESLAQAVKSASGNLLIVGGQRFQFPEAEVQSLLDAIDCSLMLVR